MIKKTAIFLLLFIFILGASGCGQVKLTRYESEFLELFDTMTKIVGYSESKEEFTRQSQLIYDHLKEYHQLYDIYNDYDGISNMKTINDNAGIKPVKVDKKIIDLLLFGREWYQKTGGKLNIAYGAVLHIWHNYREAGLDDPDNAELPPMDQLKEASNHTNIDDMIIDEQTSTVFLKDPKMSLDVGAIAKGYATEQVAKQARKDGFVHGILSVGGNVRTTGQKLSDDGRMELPWNVGIENPGKDRLKADLPILNITDDSLVTSGDYERYYTVNGKNYHHIIDPTTLYPADYCISVSILCKDSGMADALSTSVFNMPVEQGIAFIESLPDVEALWILKDGTMQQSTGFDLFIKK